MNYGRFFRLNQTLSNVVDGIAVYDYIDLPAYFGPSVDNRMSPKYPLSVTITSDAVCFRLHYGAFKLENINKKEVGPRYAYSKEDIDIKAFPIDGYDNPNKISMAHMEEVILELPYTDNVTKELSDTIKKIYISKFPLQEYENNEEPEKVSYGGRFLEQLINKRYPKSGEWKNIKRLKDEGNIEAIMYGTLRDVSDDTPSYSTLWLMDLMRDVKEDNKKKRIHLYDEKEVSVVAFLRKLLLDFMFDLKHSDVFQNSSNYQRMFSGLMSDFFFSALMHKCEYYYYRKLIRSVIDDASKIDEDRIIQLYANNLIEAERLWINDIMSEQAEKHFEHYYRANKWYHELLGHYSFSCWPTWFAEPEEEMRRVCFSMIELSNREKHVCNADTLVECLGMDLHSPDKSYAQKMIKFRDEAYEGISKWFLKRYDFNDVLHLHVTKHFNLILVTLVTLFLIWFFDANVLFANIHEKICESFKLRSASVFFIVFLLYFFLICELCKCYNRIGNTGLSSSWLEKLTITHIHVVYGNKWKIMLVIILCTIIHGYNEYFIPGLRTISELVDGLKQYVVGFIDDNDISEYLFLYVSLLLFVVLVLNRVRSFYYKNYKNLSLTIARKSITTKKLFGLLFIIALLVCTYEYYLVYGKIIVLSVLVVFFLIYYYNRWFGILPTIHPIASLHLFFPRLIAAITAAWFAMSMGFDIYVSFFDQYPQWYTALTISIVVFGFIMYEINRIMPSCSSIRKVYRSFEFLVISYCVSLLVGVVVINFVGEKFLERGGYIETYYEEYVNYPQYEGIKGFGEYKTPDKICIDSLKNDSDRIVYLTENAIKDEKDYSRKLVDSLQYIYHSRKDKNNDTLIQHSLYPIVKREEVIDGLNIFIMRDFLIMFSFIAMFWGIFISMIFTGEKQMTEL